MSSMRAYVLGLILCLSAAQASSGYAAAEVTEYNVLDFGADPTGSKDCTDAFQQALNKAGEARGAGVFAPTGSYRFERPIVIPAQVTLRGTYSYAPSFPRGRYDFKEKLPNTGTVLLCYAGEGDENGPAFITLQGNACLRGVTVFYPNQKIDATAPIPYPYAVAVRGDNNAVMDVQLLNPYNGVDASQSGRDLLRNIHGQPLHIGVYVDQVYDIGRIENVHWNPWWTYESPMFDWQLHNGIGFIFGRTDWHYVLNTFCFGYKIGYQFIQTKAGVANGNFLGIGADHCLTAVDIEETAHMGILITNGEFVSFAGEDPTHVRVRDTHSGTVRMVNCAFWGPGNRIAVVDGVGTVGFSDCSFSNWGHRKGRFAKGDPTPAFDVLGGSVFIRGCEFLEDKIQVRLGPNVERAIITENMMNGKVRIENKAKGHVIIRDNAATPTDKKFRKVLDAQHGFRVRSRLREEKRRATNYYATPRLDQVPIHME